MAIDKVTSAAITTDAVGPTQLNEASNYAFTGTVTGAGETLKPSFRASLSATQNISSSTWVKAQLNTELFDTDNCYDNSSNYRFTPTTAGKYFVFASLRHDWSSSWGNNNFTAIYKNGSAYIVNDFYGNGTGVQNYGVRACADIIDFNGTSDYVEVYGQSNSSGSQFHSSSSFFGAYKLF
jgi:hypothetical protein